MCTDSKTVRIYDSNRYAKNPSLDLTKQICSLLRPKSNTLTFDTMNVQPQGNGFDCGMFALVYATELANGRDPVRYQWNTTVLRSHLVKCFEDRCISPFPVEKERRTTMGNRIRKSVEKEIYCTCRIPNDKATPMVRCDYCHNWLHKECEGLEKDQDYEAVKWKCSICTKFVEDHA